MRIVNRSRDEGSSVPCVSSLVVVCVGEGNHRVNHSRSNFPYVAIGGYSSYVERFLGFCDGGVQEPFVHLRSCFLLVALGVCIIVIYI